MPTLINVSGDKALAIIDDSDAATVSQFRWGLTPGGYAVARVYGNLTLMHRLIRDSEGKPFVDHQNGQRLDNRRSNLRPCTPAENAGNRRKGKKDAHSQYIGVTWDKHGKRWQAFCGGVYVGRFKSEIDAAIIRDEAAQKRYGEFAKLNFPGGPPVDWVRPDKPAPRHKFGAALQEINEWSDCAVVTVRRLAERLSINNITARRYVDLLIERADWKETFIREGKRGPLTRGARRINKL